MLDTPKATACARTVGTKLQIESALPIFTANLPRDRSGIAIGVTRLVIVAMVHSRVIKKDFPITNLKTSSLTVEWRLLPTTKFDVRIHKFRSFSCSWLGQCVADQSHHHSALHGALHGCDAILAR